MCPAVGPGGFLRRRWSRRSADAGQHDSADAETSGPETASPDVQSDFPQPTADAATADGNDQPDSPGGDGPATVDVAAGDGPPPPYVVSMCSTRGGTTRPNRHQRRARLLPMWRRSCFRSRHPQAAPRLRTAASSEPSMQPSLGRCWLPPRDQLSQAGYATTSTAHLSLATFLGYHHVSPGPRQDHPDRCRSRTARPTPPAPRSASPTLPKVVRNKYGCLPLEASGD